MLRAVAIRESWDVAAFEDLAASFQLLPNGALDLLNEAAFEAAEEPLIEGDEIMTINPYALQALPG